jgi:hypothetical protein
VNARQIESVEEEFLERFDRAMRQYTTFVDLRRQLLQASLHIRKLQDELAVVRRSRGTEPVSGGVQRFCDGLGGAMFLGVVEERVGRVGRDKALCSAVWPA